MQAGFITNFRPGSTLQVREKDIIVLAVKRTGKVSDHYPRWLKPLYESGWPYTVDDAESVNYKNYTCYGCGINDRDRLYILYFEKILEKNRHYNIIEFAPTPSLSRLLKKCRM
ncbi:MAG: hypothetical protein IPG38_08590 [Chitinophagaceae bacterium]|nr:hypothetical protein [Chitinophagaceae bacterium]